MNKIALIVARYNQDLTQGLLDGALSYLSQHGYQSDAIDVFWVPGAFEIPVVAKHVIDSTRYKGLICLGIVIRGETAHFDFVSAEACRGVNQLAIDSGVPLALGVLTTENRQQAKDRVFGRKGNKGREAAQALLDTLSVIETIHTV